MTNKTYQYTGGGDGVPGLPHEVSESEASALGVSELLVEAVKNGVYVEKKSPQPAAKKAAVAAETDKE